MKNWKKETIECIFILITATLTWWWVSEEYKKSHSKEKVKIAGSLKSPQVKIYSGAWRKGHLEVKK